MKKNRLNHPHRLVPYIRPGVRRKRCSYVSFKVPGSILTMTYVSRTLRRYRANLKTPVYGFFILDDEVRAVVGGREFNIRAYAHALIESSFRHAGDSQSDGHSSVDLSVIRASSYKEAMNTLRDHYLWARRWCVHSDKRKRIVSWWLPSAMR